MLFTQRHSINFRSWSVRIVVSSLKEAELAPSRPRLQYVLAHGQANPFGRHVSPIRNQPIATAGNTASPIILNEKGDTLDEIR